MESTQYKGLGLRYIDRSGLPKKLKKSNIEIKYKMSFESYQLKNVDILETHPGRVTRKDVSMEGMVRSTSSVGHSDFHPFTNPQMHERRPNPLRFHRQMKFFQAAYHRNSFACHWSSKTDRYSRVVARHLFFDLEKSALFEAST